MFDPSKFIYHNDLLTQILIRINEEKIDEMTVYRKIELRNVTNTLYKIMVNFFSYRIKKINDIEVIIEFFNNFFMESIRKKIKIADEGVAFVIRQILLKLVAHQRVLETFCIEDHRFTIVFKYLLNVYKKLFFNSTSKIVNNIVDKLHDDDYLKDTEGQYNYIIYIDFFKELKNFINGFIDFESMKGCKMIVVEFIRKHLYLFLAHLNFGIKEDVFKLTKEKYYVLLDGIFYFNRETDKLHSHLAGRIKDFDLPKVILKFKKSIFTLGDVIYNKLIDIIDEEIALMAQFDVEKFDIETFVKAKMTETYNSIERIHSYYAVKIIKHIYVRLICRFIKEVKTKGKSWVKEHLGEKLDDFKEYFTISIKGHNMEHFSKFFEFYKKLVFTKSIEKANMMLSMMVNILGETLSVEVINAMISTRVNDTFGIQGFKLRGFYTNLIELQKKGDENISKKQKHKKRVNHLLAVFFVCIRFAGKIRLLFKRSSSFFKQPSNKRISNFNFYQINQRFDETYKIMFVRRPAFESQTDQEIMTDIQSIYSKSVLFKYSLIFRNDELFIMDERGKEVKLFFLSKFSNMARRTINQNPVLLLGYGQYERLLFMSTKIDKIEKLSSMFVKIFNRTQQIKFNYKNICIMDEKQSMTHAFIFKKMFEKTQFFIYTPDSFSSFNSDFYTNYRFHCLNKEFEELESSKVTKVIKRRRTLTDIFVDQNFQVIEEELASKKSLIRNNLQETLLKVESKDTKSLQKRAEKNEKPKMNLILDNEALQRDTIKKNMILLSDLSVNDKPKKEEQVKPAQPVINLKKLSQKERVKQRIKMNKDAQLNFVLKANVRKKSIRPEIDMPVSKKESFKNSKAQNKKKVKKKK